MVSPFIQPDMTTQNAVEYKAAIDAAVSVLAGSGAGFAPDDGGDSDMSVRVGIGVLFNRGTGNRIVTSPQSAAIAAPASNAWIVRGYVDESGVLSVAYGVAAASPVAPAYPPGAVPVFRVTVPTGTTQITNSMLIDERAWNSGYGTLKNTFLITSSATFACPAGAKFLRLTAAGGGGGGGPGASAAADATKYGGGGGGGAACVVARLFNPENLSIVIGAGGLGGTSASAAGGVVGQVGATAGGSTSVTGAVSGLTFTCAGGGLGGPATAAANGAVGAAGAAGTGIAGTAGGVATAGIKGGDGGGVGTGSSLSAGGKGAILVTTRTGSSGQRGSGGGGAIGFGSSEKGGNGGDGFVLIEVF